MGGGEESGGGGGVQTGGWNALCVCSASEAVQALSKQPTQLHHQLSGSSPRWTRSRGGEVRPVCRLLSPYLTLLFYLQCGRSQRQTWTGLPSGVWWCRHTVALREATCWPWTTGSLTSPPCYQLGLCCTKLHALRQWLLRVTWKTILFFCASTHRGEEWGGGKGEERSINDLHYV